jgi:hypothetical protein
MTFAKLKRTLHRVCGVPAASMVLAVAGTPMPDEGLVAPTVVHDGVLVELRVVARGQGQGQGIAPERQQGQQQQALGLPSLPPPHAVFQPETGAWGVPVHAAPAPTPVGSGSVAPSGSAAPRAAVPVAAPAPVLSGGPATVAQRLARRMALRRTFMGLQRRPGDKHEPVARWGRVGRWHRSLPGSGCVCVRARSCKRTRTCVAV